MPSHISKRTTKGGKTRWVVTFPAGEVTPDGKPTYTCKTFDLKRDAQEHLDELKAQRRTGGAVVETGITLSAFLDRYLASLDVRENTAASYKELLDRHVRPALGRMRVKNLSSLKIQELYKQMQKDGLSPRTVRYVHSILHSALDQAVGWKLLRANPAKAKGKSSGKSGVALPEKKKPEIRYLQGEELREFRLQIAGDRYAAFFDFALATGARPGEIMGLEWSALDLEGGSVKIRQTLVTAGKEWFLRPTKTDRSHRTIPLPREAVAALVVHRQIQAKWKDDAKTSWQDHGLVFTNVIGEPLDGRNLKHRHLKPALKRAADTLYPADELDRETQGKRAALAACSLYSLRHTHATRLIEAGISPATVSERLGHKDVGFTLDTYVHVTDEMQKSATEEIRKALYD